VQVLLCLAPTASISPSIGKPSWRWEGAVTAGEKGSSAAWWEMWSHQREMTGGPVGVPASKKMAMRHSSLYIPQPILAENIGG
jgi:hypothetical protein